MEIEVHVAREEDEPFLAALFAEVHGAELAPAGLPAGAAAQLLEMQYRGQTMSYRAQFPQGKSSIVWLGGERIGRVFVNESGEELRVVDIALSRRFQGRGLGTKLLEDCGRHAHAKGIPVRLSVRPGSGAMRLYERVGFVVVSATQTHVEMEWKVRTPGEAIEQASVAEDGSGGHQTSGRLEASSSGFRSVVGQDLFAELGGGVEVPLRVTSVRPLVSKQPDVVANDSFVVSFEGPMDTVLAPATYLLTYGEGEAVSSLALFLSPLGGRGDAMHYEAIFNRMTLDPRF
jgi:ribosomal protein S18 acetylase RimI-like enzyme